ncbi:MAG: DoxX family membrane protein [Candidatus Kapabacteria bacterium]|nr:DoxX family membrane protein [Candidatus Kapabacteria bacterium]
MNSLMPWIGLVLRAYVGGYFILAAVPKIVEPLAFATAIGHYGLLPNGLINASALILPWLEIIVGIMLVVGFRVRLGALLAGGMVIVFTIAVAYAVMLGLKIDCGCFGSSGGDEVSWWKVAKNTGMVLMCAVLWKWPKTSLSIETGMGFGGSKPA